MFLAATLASTVAAFAALAPQNQHPVNPANVTVVYKDTFSPVAGPIVLKYCGLEDCSDTPQS